MSSDECWADRGPAPLPAPGEPGANPFYVVGVGASAGGVEALLVLLRNLPSDTGMAMVIVTHLAPDRPSNIATVLGRATALPVVEATDGKILERNEIYVIPPNTRMTIQGGALRLERRPAGHGPFKPVDAFLMSLAHERRRESVGVILSGGDADGRVGLLEIKRVGGVTFAQDETARVSSMPQNSIESGAADFVLPPDVIALELARIAQRPVQPLIDDANGPYYEDLESQLGAADFEEILELLRHATGSDLREYKPSTVRRRLLRRMALRRIHDVADFIALLRSNPMELWALHNDILIYVTRFFRDAEAFRALESVLPSMIENVRTQRREGIRVWVPACASGEEAYSIAICMLEALGDSASRISVQIFATDISEVAIARARNGAYARDIEADLSPERLRRFFAETETGYRIAKGVRDMCIFAPHDLVRDPPFSRLDLVSCRNLLIYLSGSLQKRVIPMFHYALNPDGHLFLGSAESVGSFSDLFAPVDKRWNLYRKLPGASYASLPQTMFERSLLPTGRAESARTSVAPELDVQKEAVLSLLPLYAPPGVVINEQLEVLHVLGRTGPYLELPPGRANFHLLSMVRAGLRAELFHAVRGALEVAEPVQVQASLEDLDRTIQIRITPLGADPMARPRYRLIVFDDGQAPQPQLGPPPPQEPLSRDSEAALGQSRREVEALRLHLQSVLERHEAAQEELQSANEEILSSNEELQSTNEELQTTKEEVEATNEELSTINDELQARVAELLRLNDDWSNVLSSVQIPMLILGVDGRIRSFTSAAGPLFNLIGGDIGRPLSNINIGMRISDLTGMLAEVLDTLVGKTAEVQDGSGRWYLLRVRPYRTHQHQIDGLILVLQDIDDLKRAGEEVQRAAADLEVERDYTEALIATVRHPLVLLDASLRVQRANPAFYRTFVASREESEGRAMYELGNGQWDNVELRRLLQEVISRDQHFDEFEVDHDFPRIGRRVMRISARRVQHRAGGERIFVAIEDRTERLAMEAALEARERELREEEPRRSEFLAVLAHELRTPLASIVHGAELLRDPTAQRALPNERATRLMLRQAERMTRLIDDLTDVSRLMRDGAQLDHQPLDLRGVLEDAIEAVQSSVEAKRQELHVSLPDEPLPVRGDAVRLEQLFGNLLDNARKYTGEGGRIDLVAEPEADDAVVVRVRDNGAGIAPTLLPGILDLFGRRARRDPRFDGLGVGLSIVRSLAMQHGGMVHARSAGEGRGSEFSVRLPRLSPGAWAAHAPVSAPVATQAAVGQPLRVLVVEDDEDAAEILAALLMSWGHRVEVAHDAFAALDAAPALRPDTVLVNIGLPRMSGYELAQRLREQPGGEHIPLVAMTGYGGADDARRSREVGFEHHLVKPVATAVLRELLQTLQREDEA